MTACDGTADLQCLVLILEGSAAIPGWRLHASSSDQRKENNPVPQLEMNLAPTADDMPDMAIALIRAIIAAADKTGTKRPCCSSAANPRR